MSLDVLVVAHTGRGPARLAAVGAVRRLLADGATVRLLAEEAGQLAPDAHRRLRVVEGEGGVEGAELVLVLGGDGTLLRAAALARHCATPLLGVNLGHVGFLAEAEPEALEAVLDAVLAGAWTVEERLTIDATVSLDDRVLTRSWALNEASLEKTDRARMVEFVVGVDGRPLVAFAADGVVVATPTGSTAYAFSAGGPVIWPDTEALLLVPVAAHALFARPLVISPRSTFAVEVQPGESTALLSCDGRPTAAVPAHARLEVTASKEPVRLARILDTPFTDRLVRKFMLPVGGWRGAPRSEYRPQPRVEGLPTDPDT